MPFTLRPALVTADSHWSLTPLNLRLAPVPADSHCSLMSLTLRLAPVPADLHQSLMSLTLRLAPVPADSHRSLTGRLPLSEKAYQFNVKHENAISFMNYFAKSIKQKRCKQNRNLWLSHTLKSLNIMITNKLKVNNQ